MNKRKVWIFTFSLVIALIAIYSSRYFYRETKVDNFFTSVKKGDRKLDLITSLGTPDSTGQCGKWLWWGDDSKYIGENKGECVEWIRYNFFLHAYGFGFSKDGKIVSKYQYFSE